MTTLSELKWQLKPWIKQIIAAGGSSSGPFAPANVPVIVASASADLTAERVLTAGAIIALTDGGANSTMTVAVDSSKIAWTSGKISIAVTAGKTLTLAAADNYTLTVPATGTAVLGTGAANGITYWTGANNVTADASYFSYDPTNKRMIIGSTSYLSALDLLNIHAQGSNPATIALNAGVTGASSQMAFFAGGTRYWDFGKGIADGSANFYIYDSRGTAAIRFALTSQTGKVGIGDNLTAPGARLHVQETTATTTGTLEVSRIDATCSGTTAATFGGSLTQYAKNAATAASVLVGYIAHTFSEVGATYKGQISHYVADSVSAAGREALRLYADGVAAITKVIGSLELPYAALSADTTLTSAHWGVDVTCSSADITITLPAAATCTGRVYNIKKVDATAYKVIIDGNGSETIDGTTTKDITTQYDNLEIQSTGSGWSIR